MNPQFENNPVREGRSKKSPDYNPGISMPSSILVKAKLEMTEPGDADEREADEMADSIVNEGKVSRAVSSGHSGGGVALPSHFGSQIASFQGQGSRLYGGLKEQMESGFGRDFSDVRLHTDDAAAEMSSSISAKAFTYGNDIFFNRDQYRPDTKAGLHLIAHELTHIVRGGGMLARKDDGNNYKRYIHDVNWIGHKVLYNDKGNTAWNILQSNYEKKRTADSKCITVFLYTSHLNACHGEYKDYCAFELHQYKGYFNDEEKIRYKDVDLNGFLIQEQRTNVYVIEGADNWEDSLTNLVNEYGDLQNVVVVGHGNYNVVQLNDNNFLSDGLIQKIKVLFKLADKNQGKRLKHSVLLNECLTASSLDPNVGIAAKVAKEMYDPDLDVIVRGNRASVWASHSLYKWDQDDYLRFYNEMDPDSPTDVKYTPNGIESNQDRYSGWQLDGVFYDLVKRIKYHKDRYIDSSDYIGCYDTKAYSLSKSFRDDFCDYYYMTINYKKPRRGRIYHYSFELLDFVDYIGDKLRHENENVVLGFISFIYHYVYAGSFKRKKPHFYAEGSIKSIDDLYSFYSSYIMKSAIVDISNILGLQNPIRNFKRVEYSSIDKIPFGTQ